ncbi:hypothetical protein GCM10023093_15530 [Nemorincola caseinilytica]|uniref:Outer membrane protein beta-barrel domain-containing protein n=1 Tax=Nemorincola caseinilytica TaxID=2054315 RepID=A0ABP8NEQ5_9BACT
MKKILLAVLLMMGFTGAMAQQVYNSSGKANYKKKKKTGYDPDKLVLGGGINFGLGQGYAILGVSPLVGYRIAKPLFVGLGVGYLYLQRPDKIDQFDHIHMEYKNIVSPSVWARCIIYRNIYAVATYEYDIINRKSSQYDVFTGTFDRVKENLTNQCVFVGLGAKQSVGGRVSICPELVYDVLQGQNSPYPAGAPSLRVNVMVGL